VNVIHATARSQKTQARRDRKREAILDAAAAILGRGEELTMKSLARECDLSVGAAYRYFPGKQALLTGLQIRAVQALEAHLELNIAGARDPLARIEAAAGTWASFGAAHPTLFRLVDSSLSDPDRQLSDEEAASVEVALSPVLTRIAGLFDDAVDAGLLVPGDSEMRTHALWAALHGVGHFRKRRTPPNGEDLERELVRAILAGWRKP